MPWHVCGIAEFCIRLVPTLVCLVALLLLLDLHRADFRFAALMHVAFLSEQKELAKHNVNGNSMGIRSRAGKTVDLTLLKRQWRLGRVVDVQQTPIGSIFFPGQMPGSA